ncbi:DUF3631 domain-containing protein [Chloroflexota bacterium]
MPISDDYCQLTDGRWKLKSNVAISTGLSNQVDLKESREYQRQMDGTTILGSIVTFIRRFVILSQQQADAITLWVIHTHAFNAADTTAYLNIYSPEKRSGKTRLLEDLELLVARPWFTGRVTAAVLSRKIDKECPTLLLDESDAAFKGEKEYSETLRALLNTGYRRGGVSSVCTGQGANIGYKDLSTFCPKAIAGIGKLPDTVADRSIPIILKRRAPDESVERFRRRKVEQEAFSLRQQIVKWVEQAQLTDSEPDIPLQLDDRAADCWEPLLAIAYAVGNDWPRRARDAAIALMNGEEREDESLGVKLLSDIKFVFGNDEQISSADLVSKLLQIEESPWGDIRGKILDTRRLAYLLKPYYIRPVTIRINEKTPKGYRKADFEDAWSRYLLPIGDLSATPQQPASAQAQERAPKDPQQTGSKALNVADSSRSYVECNVADVADKNGDKEENVIESGKTRPWEVEL